MITEAQKEDLLLLINFARKPGNRNLALMPTKDHLGNDVTVVVAVVYEENGDALMTPIARLFSGDPYDEVETPEGTEVIQIPLMQNGTLN